MPNTTNAQRVAKARAKLLQEGGRRFGCYFQPDAAAALDALLAAGYAPTAAEVVATALRDALRKVGRIRGS